MVSAPSQGKAQQVDITDEMRLACESLVAPFSETMLDLLAAVEPEYQERVRKNVILSGRGSRIRGLAGGAREEPRPSSAAARSRWSTTRSSPAPNGGLAIALDADEADWEKLSA